MSLDLSAIRTEIDEVDHEIVALLEKRMHLVDQVVAYKEATGMPIYDGGREAAILEKVAQLVQDKSYQSTIVDTFEAMMRHSRNFQKGQLDGKQ